MNLPEQEAAEAELSRIIKIEKLVESFMCSLTGALIAGNKGPALMDLVQKTLIKLSHEEMEIIVKQ